LRFDVGRGADIDDRRLQFFLAQNRKKRQPAPGLPAGNKDSPNKKEEKRRVATVRIGKTSNEFLQK
jgi:hypothetical protein